MRTAVGIGDRCCQQSFCRKIFSLQRLKIFYLDNFFVLKMLLQFTYIFKQHIHTSYLIIFWHLCKSANAIYLTSLYNKLTSIEDLFEKRGCLLLNFFDWQARAEDESFDLQNSNWCDISLTTTNGIPTKLTVFET